MDDTTITPEALAGMSIEKCIQRAEDENANGEAAEEEAKQACRRANEAEELAAKEVAKEVAKAEEARMRALRLFRDSGQWWVAVKTKAEETDQNFGPIVEAHCKATGKGDTAISENMRIYNSWGRFDWAGSRRADGSAGNAQTQPGLPTSKRSFLRMLEEMDGKRGSGDKPKKPKKPKNKKDEKENKDENKGENKDNGATSPPPPPPRTGTPPEPGTQGPTNGGSGGAGGGGGGDAITSTPLAQARLLLAKMVAEMDNMTGAEFAWFLGELQTVLSTVSSRAGKREQASDDTPKPAPTKQPGLFDDQEVTPPAPLPLGEEDDHVEEMPPEALPLKEKEDYTVGDAAVAGALEVFPIWLATQISNGDIPAPDRWEVVNGKRERLWNRQDIEDARSKVPPKRKAA